MKAHVSFTSFALALLFTFATTGRLYAQFIDMGDAPDSVQSPQYPTLMVNSGASHEIIPQFHLGWGNDYDPDGQPDIQALGDDINLVWPGNPYPPGDEDGVVFTSLLVQGKPTSVTVTATTNGVLDAWVDFNADGDWNDTGEHVFNGTLLSGGPNNLNFTVPAGATTGWTYARFRFTSGASAYIGGAAVPHDYASDGEVEDYKVYIEQTEDDHKMHWPQYPDPDGWDVRACETPPVDQEPEGIQKVLADDFLCTSNGYINHITFWGSWLYDEFLDEQTHPFQGITNIHLSLHTDIPDPDGEGPEYSRPGELLWERDIDPMLIPPGWELPPPIEEEPSWQGWYDPNTGLWETNNHQRYFRYEVFIPEDEALYQTNGLIYWLDISMQTEFGLWGWKTSRSPHFNDDAVWTDLPVTNHNQWNELRDPIYSNSLDLAFIINEQVEDPLVDWGDAPDGAAAALYPTLSVNSGANHTLAAGMFLGAGVDSEPDGQPNATATGDDTNINGLGGIAFPPGDEDGVTITALVPGLPATITVTASMAGYLDAWIDYNGSGSWTGGEQLLGGSIALNVGINNINITVPTWAVPTASTMARFRYSAAGGLLPTGSAPDGEVEDYQVIIDNPYDWGDAPDPTYLTLSTSGGAVHRIGNTTLRLGNSLPDPEFDGQPTANADGDDLDAQGDDEDGIVFLTPLIPGTIAQINAIAWGGGFGCSLDAWVDFNADGDWNDAGEQIFTSIGLGLGLPNHYLFFQVPTNATPATNTYARFRISYAGGLSPGGLAPDGEVEDYKIFIEDKQDIDWGDAPDALQSPYYPTLLANNGAHHVLSALFMGSKVDPEPDGQPTPSSDGDDTDILYPSAGDDEDGVSLTSLLMPGGYASVDVVASAPGMLDAWIDFGNDGSWAQVGDRIFTTQALVAGTNSLIFPVPISAAQTNAAYSRFRISSGGVASYTGLATSGEVEDHEFFIEEIEAEGIDFGDAPNTFPTLLAVNGARHTIVPGIILGATIDPEPDGQPNSAATGDDQDIVYGPPVLDDEDGVTFTSKIVAGTNASVDVVAGVSGGLIDAWIDFNADGDWNDAGEKILASTPVSGGFNTLSFSVPQPSALGPTHARFRITSAGIANPTGAANNGEVEDYMVDLYQPQTSTNIIITNLFFTASNTVAQVEWNSESNITYQVQSSTNLTTNVWVDVGGWLLGPVNWQTNSTAPTQQFYRVTAPWTE